jgi:hypothetical protein
MKEGSIDRYTRGDGCSRDFRRCIKATERKLKWLSDAEFINWDKAVLACPEPGFFPEDRDFAVLNAAMWNERRRRCDKHNGTFGWRRFWRLLTVRYGWSTMRRRSDLTQNGL